MGHGAWAAARDRPADSHWKVWDKPFCDVACDGGDTLALRWESEELRAVGAAMYTFLRDQAVSQGISVAGAAVIGAAFSAMTLPLAMVQATDMIDSAWEVASRRADLAGKQLAQVLVQRVHGYRPVTLVGFGLGARLIMHALLELASLGESGKGIVETAALLGTPFGVEAELWSKASSVVGHRLINAHIDKDWMLSLIYRSSSFKRKIAGLAPVQVRGETRAARVIENMDLSNVVKGHWEYREKLTQVAPCLPLPCSSLPGVFRAGVFLAGVLLVASPCTCLKTESQHARTCSGHPHSWPVFGHSAPAATGRRRGTSTCATRRG